MMIHHNMYDRLFWYCKKHWQDGNGENDVTDRSRPVPTIRTLREFGIIQCKWIRNLKSGFPIHL